MAATLLNNLGPSEVGNTDEYNRLQMRRAILSRGDPNEEPMLGGAGELLRVLVVDNNRDFASTTSRLVGIWGHDVRTAHDAQAALALAATFRPEIVLLDVIMPQMNGFELAAALRRIAGLNKCFLVAVTGCSDEGHRLRCEAAGIDLFLIKPVTPSILKALLTWELEYALRARHDEAIQRLFSTPLPSTDSANQLNSEVESSEMGTLQLTS